MNQTTSTSSSFKSQLGVILSALGAAIGLGGIWRFAYLAYNGGGAAFMMAYVVAILSLGIPLLLLEFALGNFHVGSAPSCFAKINKKWEWLGWWMVNYSFFASALYYVVLIGWCCAYLYYGLNLAWGLNPQAFFHETFTNNSVSPLPIGAPVFPVLLFLFLVSGITWSICHQGISKGLERTNKIFMPLLGIIMLVLFFWSVCLDGATIGLKQYFIPNWNRLADPLVWFDAFGHAFFSIGILFGIMCAYASYIPKGVDLIHTARITVIGTALFNVFSGCIVFSILGFMSKTQNIPIKDLIQSGSGLAFITYPQAINQLAETIGHVPARIYAVSFFLCLIMAGLSTSIGYLESFCRPLMDKFNLSRTQAVNACGLLLFLGGILFTTHPGHIWIDIVDTYVVTYGLVISGCIQCILIAWRSNALPILLQHINASSQYTIGKHWTYSIQYLAPCVLLFLIGCAIHTHFVVDTSNIENKIIGTIWAWILVFLAFCLAKKK